MHLTWCFSWGNKRIGSYYGRSVMADGTVHSNRPDTVILDKTIKQAHSVDTAIPKSHNFHSTVTERLQQYTGWKEELTRIQQLKTAHTVPPVLSTEGIISNSNTNCPYSTTSTVHRRYYLKQQYKRRTNDPRTGHKREFRQKPQKPPIQ
jgi:hypothetical protein